MKAVEKRHEYFSVHKLNNHGFEKAEFIRAGFDGLLSGLEKVCKDGREFSIVKTKLEEACFYAKKAMAMDEVNQIKKDA